MFRIQELLLILIIAIVPFQLTKEPDSLLAGMHVRVALLLACLVVAVRRIQLSKDPLPLELLNLTVVKFYLVYLILGFLDLFWVERPYRFFLEFSRHITWALIPIYVYSLGPVSVRSLKIAFLLLCVTSSVLSLYSFHELQSAHAFETGAHVAAGSLAKGSILETYGKNTIGATAACGFIIGTVYLLSVRHIWLKLALGSASLVNLAFLVKAGSKAYLIASIAFACFLLYRDKRTRKSFLLTAGSCCILGFMAAIWIFGSNSGAEIKHSLYTRYYNASTESVNMRVAIVRNSLDYLAKNPLGATGWRQLERYARNYQNVPEPPFDVNILLTAWLDVGPLGAVAQAISIGAFAVMLARNQKYLPSRSALSQINLCIIGMTMAFIAHDMQDTSGPHHQLVMYFVCVGIGCFICMLIDYRRSRQFTNRLAGQPSI